jgi:hypothetical protein
MLNSGYDLDVYDGKEHNWFPNRSLNNLEDTVDYLLDKEGETENYGLDDRDVVGALLMGYSVSIE